MTIKIGVPSKGRLRKDVLKIFKKNPIPTAVICRTIKGKGISFMENSVLWHYRTPVDEEYEDALRELSALPSPAAERVAKVIKSAASNAENELMSRISDLKIVEAYANEGPTLKRFRARARGRAFRILKRSSHVTVVVDDTEAREAQVGT